MVTLGGDGHLPLIVLGDIDLLSEGDHLGVAHGVVGQVGLYLLVPVGAYTDHISLVPHAQYDVHGIDLLMPLDITLDGGGGSLDDLLEELIYSVCGAATE